MMNAENQVSQKHYTKLLNKIGDILEKGRKAAKVSVNSIMLMTYWEIGWEIVEFEQKGKVKADYGSKLLDRMSRDLKSIYGKGFSRSNVIYMRLLYIKYPKSETLSHQLSWSHYFELLKISDDLERSFYERQAIPENQKYSETHLEKRLIDNLQQFLLELGKGFAFIGRQYRISLSNTHFYVDLVFYHRILKCFVLIDLKVKEVNHYDIGQMNMYLNYFKKEENVEGDNEPVGIILSKDKDELLVEYATGGISNKLFVSKYQTYLPDKKILRARLNELLEKGKDEID